MTKEEKLKKKAGEYLPCLINECPHHKTCLHWLAGQYGDPDATIIKCVNPYNPKFKAGNCCHYRENITVTYAVGMMHLLDEIPYHQARSIKYRLIKLFGRTRFYEYRNGKRPIAPEQQQLIEQVCREEGWMGEIRYDGWDEDYLW